MAEGYTLEVKLTGAGPKYSGAGEGMFELLSEIGAGTFSVVFKARRVSDGKLVAVKKIKVKDIRDEKSKTGCMQEMALLQELDHPHIVKYYTSFIERGDLNIVLELADGGDLARFMQHFRRNCKLIPEPTIWKYFSQVCAALKYMHLKRIMHRDVKPANVFITRDGLIKLGDLGMARFLRLQSAAANTLLGTPYYMSPERVQQQEYDFRSDVWSAGCLLYEMAALQSPFSNDAKNLVSLFKKIVKSDYPPLPSNIYSDELRALISVCMDPNPMKRRDMSYAYTVATQMYERFVRAAVCKPQVPPLV